MGLTVFQENFIYKKMGHICPMSCSFLASGVEQNEVPLPLIQIHPDCATLPNFPPLFGLSHSSGETG